MRLSETTEIGRGRKIFVSVAVLTLFLISGTLSTAIAKAPCHSDWRSPLVEGERKLQTKELVSAESAFRQALRNVKCDKNSQSEDIALCMQSLAYALYMQDNFEDVLPLHKKALKVIEKAYGKESPKNVAPYVILGALYEDEGEYKPAVKYYMHAVDITAKTEGKGTLAYADYLHRLGRATFKDGFPKAAEDMYYNSLLVAMRQPSLPSSDPLKQQLSDYIDLLTKAEYRGKILGSYFQKELLKDRVSSLERSASVAGSRWNKEVSVRIADGANSERIFPPAPISTSLSDATTITPDRPLSDFAALESINKQRVAFYERMIATDIDSLGPDHPSVARDLGGLASIYLAQRKFAQARPLLTRALSIYEKTYSQDAAPVQRTKALLEVISAGKVQGNRGASAEVANYVASLPQIARAAQKLEIAYRLNDLAFACYCQGKIEQADQIYSWAVASTAAAAGERSMLAAASLIDYSRVLRSAHKQAESDAMDSAARQILRRAMAANASRLIP